MSSTVDTWLERAFAFLIIGLVIALVFCIGADVGVVLADDSGEALRREAIRRGFATYDETGAFLWIDEEKERSR